MNITYVIRTLRIGEVKPFHMDEFSKFYCKFCSFQGLQKASSAPNLQEEEHAYDKGICFRFFFDPANTLTKHVSPCIVVICFKVFVIITTFQEFIFIVKYCLDTSTFVAHSLYSIRYEQ